MPVAHRSRHLIVVAALAVSVAGCSSSGHGSLATHGVRSHGSSSGPDSDGVGNGDGKGSVVKVLQTGVVPLLGSDGEGQTVIYAKVRNTSTKDAPVIIGWTGYAASGAKLPSDEDSLGPQDSSGLVVPAGRTTYVATVSIFEGARPARLVATPHNTDVPPSDTGLSVTSAQVSKDEVGRTIVSTIASHGTASSSDADDEWTAVNSLDLICTNPSGAVSAVGFLKPAHDLTGVSFEGHPRETFTLEADAGLPSGARCLASADQWLGDG